MITEYGGKEKYASKKEQMKHESKETSKKEQVERELGHGKSKTEDVLRELGHGTSNMDKSGSKPMPDNRFKKEFEDSKIDGDRYYKTIKSGSNQMQGSKAPQGPVKKKIVLGKSNVDVKDMHRTDNNPVGTVKSAPTEKEIKKVQADSKRKIILAKKTEGPKNADGRTAAQEKEYMEAMDEQVRMGRESDERFKKTPTGLVIEAKKAENKGNMKEARRLYEAAKKAGLINKSL
jgi:hypothetical protein